MPRQRVLMGGLILVGLILAISFPLFMVRRAAPYRESLGQRELAARVLGQFLASQFQPSTGLVFSNPFTQEKGRRPEVYAYEAAGLNGLKQGLGAQAIKVVFPEIKPEFRQDPNSAAIAPKTTTPLSYLTSANSWARLIQENADRPVVVSLIGLPADVTRLEAWRKSDGPRWAFLLPDWRVLGGRDAVRAAFQSGRVVAAVMERPSSLLSKPPRDAGTPDEFNRHFVLLTKETLEEAMKTYPQLFP